MVIYWLNINYYYYFLDKVIKDLTGQEGMHWEVEGYEHTSWENGRRWIFLLLHVQCSNSFLVFIAVQTQVLVAAKSLMVIRQNLCWMICSKFSQGFDNLSAFSGLGFVGETLKLCQQISVNFIMIKASFYLMGTKWCIYMVQLII